jgi:hypothetical protein
VRKEEKEGREGSFASGVESGGSVNVMRMEEEKRHCPDDHETVTLSSWLIFCFISFFFHIE